MYQLGNAKKTVRERDVQKNNTEKFSILLRNQVKHLSNGKAKEDLEKLFKNIKESKLTRKDLLLCNSLWTEISVPIIPLEKNYFKIYQKQYDIEQLKNDLKTAILNMNTTWVDKGANKKWKSITLKSVNGGDQSFLEKKDFLEVGKTNSYKYTKAMNNCNYFKKLLEDIPTDIYLVRILKLDEGGSLGYHIDDNVFAEKEKVMRCHVPIISHPKTEFGIGFPIAKRPPDKISKDYPTRKEWNALDLDRKHLEPGFMYYTNVNTLHAVYNPTNVARYHLCIDMRPPELMLSMLNQE